MERSTSVFDIYPVGMYYPILESRLQLILERLRGGIVIGYDDIGI